MPAEQPYLPRPGVSEQAIVEEMLRNRDAEHWKLCYEFVKRHVYIRTKNFSWSNREEIVQEVMCKIFVHLPNFHFKCALKTWLFQIIGNCIIDEHRRLQHQELLHVPLVETLTEVDHEGEGFKAIEKKSVSVEESFERREEIRNGVASLLEYAGTHSDPVRNRQIVRIVLLEGHTQAETANRLGCSAGIVQYVAREAQRYAREKMEP